MAQKKLRIMLQEIEVGNLDIYSILKGKSLLKAADKLGKGSTVRLGGHLRKWEEGYWEGLGYRHSSMKVPKIVLSRLRPALTNQGGNKFFFFLSVLLSKFRT